MADQINYRRHGLVDTSSITLAAADFGIVDAAEGAEGAEGADAPSSARRELARSLPSLAGATTWLNSPPLASEELRGKVVAVDFCTYTCINWLRTLPYVRAWARKYQDAGLVVVGVHTPEFPFEHELQNVRRALKAMHVAYPVAIDNAYALWEAFDNHYWPALYLVDAQGRLRHQQFGEGEYEEAERILQQLLEEGGGGGFAHELVTRAARGPEVTADWAHLASGETYLGAERAQRFAPPGGAGGRMDGRARVRGAHRRPWAHRLPLSRPRSAPGHGTRRARTDGTLSRVP
jgi:hypothetical protein